MKNQSPPLFKVTYINQGKSTEIHCRQVYQSSMWGFIEVEEFVFAPSNSLIVEIDKENFRNEFFKVRRSFIPLQHIIRIDEISNDDTQLDLGKQCKPKNMENVVNEQLESIRVSDVEKLGTGDTGIDSVDEKFPNKPIPLFLNSMFTDNSNSS